MFDVVNPRYSIEPTASMWRVMLKQWVMIMHSLNEGNLKMCGYMLLRERETFLKELAESD